MRLRIVEEQAQQLYLEKYHQWLQENPNHTSKEKSLFTYRLENACQAPYLKMQGYCILCKKKIDPYSAGAMKGNKSGLSQDCYTTIYRWTKRDARFLPEMEAFRLARDVKLADGRLKIKELFPGLIPFKQLIEAAEAAGYTRRQVIKACGGEGKTVILPLNPRWQVYYCMQGSYRRLDRYVSKDTLNHLDQLEGVNLWWKRQMRAMEEDPVARLSSLPTS